MQNYVCFGRKYKRELYKRKISSIRENIIPPSQAEGVCIALYTVYLEGFSE